ncbi:MAG: cytochrome c3 family protein [Desulfobacterales bacterium]
MNSKKEMRLAYGLAVVLFVVGVFSYAAFSKRAPEEPIRLMFETSAGSVLFLHKTHTVPSGYGISCFDCHHHPQEDESAIRSCGDCHGPEEAEATQIEACMECHYADEIEGLEMVKRSDAFHSQCIECHDDFEKGPTECAGCHVM